jgi:hypothetical protein
LRLEGKQKQGYVHLGVAAPHQPRTKKMKGALSKNQIPKRWGCARADDGDRRAVAAALAAARSGAARPEGSRHLSRINASRQIRVDYVRKITLAEVCARHNGQRVPSRVEEVDMLNLLAFAVVVVALATPWVVPLMWGYIEQSQ